MTHLQYPPPTRMNNLNPVYMQKLYSSIIVFFLKLI
jgi:hypothetical protein